MSENTVPKKKFGAGAAEFFRGVKAEFKKIVWPDKKTLLNNTGVVIAFVLIMGVIVFILDWIFGTTFRAFIKL